MLIPITFNPTPNRQETPKLPSTLAKISNDEVILIELQGNLEGPQSLDKNGQLVGELTIDETGSVKFFF
jgi:chromosome transmission fidelity protein 8